MVCLEIPHAQVSAGVAAIDDGTGGADHRGTTAAARGHRQAGIGTVAEVVNSLVEKDFIADNNLMLNMVSVIITGPTERNRIGAHYWRKYHTTGCSGIRISNLPPR